MPIFSDGVLHDKETKLPIGTFAMHGDTLVSTRDFTDEEKQEYMQSQCSHWMIGSYEHLGFVKHHKEVFDKKVNEVMDIFCQILLQSNFEESSEVAAFREEFWREMI